MKKTLIEHYKDFLPINKSTPSISLGEGFTPLVKSVNFSKKFESEIYFKLEGCNPSGSFKDRGMFLAVAKAIQNNKSKIISDSEIDSFMRSLMGLDSILAPCIRKMPDKPPMSAALLVSNFLIILLLQIRKICAYLRVFVLSSKKTNIQIVGLVL